MLTGRGPELTSLQESYEKGENTFVILYGRKHIGKTALIREFMKDKKCLYYSAVAASEKQQLELFQQQMTYQFPDITGHEYVPAEDYRGIFEQVQAVNDRVKVLIIDEFQHVVRNSKTFMESMTQLVKGNLFQDKVMVICTSSSISWVENSMVANLGEYAYSITSFLKLKELSFVDTVRMFPAYSVPESMMIYAITGGVPGYMAQFTDKVSIKENICQQILTKDKMLRSEGADYIREELRETSLYNTILYCIAGGEYKLNELHVHTGFGRDKISVYLKNLMEREIVDKLFSFDAEGNVHTRKGLYRIKAGFMEFWFRYIYPHESQLMFMEPEEFYDRYVEGTLDAFAADTFVKVGTEYIDLLNTMNQLPIKISHRGRWWGKTGNIDIIARDEDYHYVIGKCNWLSDCFSFEMFEELMYNVNLAGIGKNYIYLFSKGTFDEELTMFAKENHNVKLIQLSDL